MFYYCAKPQFEQERFVMGYKHQNLRIPGPTPVPPTVLLASAKPMINHRGPEFSPLMERITLRLKHFYQTKGDVLVFPSAGTGGMEAAIVNVLSPGDKVLGVTIGVFGDRFITIAERFGAEVIKLSFPWGRAAHPDLIEQLLSDNRDIKAVLITHNETSTGVTNDLAAIGEVMKKFPDVLYVVDAISGMAALPFKHDEWGVDVAISGSQKAWMIPPGLSMVSVSEKAWKAHQAAKMPRFYWDFSAAKKSLEKWQNPYTPPVSLLYALDESLSIMEEEGLENIMLRHQRIGEATRAGIRGLGLELFADPAHYSNAVTAVKAPEGMDGKLINTMLRDEYNVVIGGGQKDLAGRIFRIGHLGFVSLADILGVLAALEMVLPRLGVSITPWSGVKAAEESYAQALTGGKV